MYGTVCGEPCLNWFWRELYISGKALRRHHGCPLDAEHGATTNQLTRGFHHNIKLVWVKTIHRFADNGQFQCVCKTSSLISFKFTMVKLTPNRSHDCALCSESIQLLHSVFYTFIERHQRTAKLNGTSLCCGSGQVLGQQQTRTGRGLRGREGERETDSRC